MKKGISVLVLCALIFTTMFGVIPVSADEAESEPLVVAVQSYYCSYPVGLIQAKEMAKDYGLNLEYEVFSSGATINEAMGEWDIAVTGGAFVYALANYNCKLIAHQIDGTACNDIVCRPDSKYAEVKDDPEALKEAVRGSNILCNVGTTGHYGCCLWLASLGLTPEDVNFISMEFATVYNSWLAGEGDLCVMIAPYCNYESDDVVLSSLGACGGHLYESTVCTQDAYENRYDDVVKFVQLLYKACDELYADPDLQLETAYNWYVDNGKEMEKDAVLAEVEAKPVFNSEYAKQLDLTEFACSYAEYFASQEFIEEGQLETVKANCANDVLTDAMKDF